MIPTSHHSITVYPDKCLHVSRVLTHGAEVVEYAYGGGLLQDLLLVVLEDGQGKPEQDLAALVEEGVPDTQHGLVMCVACNSVYKVWCGTMRGPTSTGRLST